MASWADPPTPEREPRCLECADVDALTKAGSPWCWACHELHEEQAVAS